MKALVIVNLLIYVINIVFIIKVPKIVKENVI
jgi:hypothetical protein